VVLLESGDFIEVGAETRLLFVSPGDDPENVLDDYLERTGQKPEPRPVLPPVMEYENGEDAGIDSTGNHGTIPANPMEEAAAASVPSFLEGVKDAPGSITESGDPGTRGTESLSLEEVEQQEKRAKVKKYMMAGAVYLCVMVVVFGLVFMLHENKGNGRRSSLKDYPEQPDASRLRDVFGSSLKFDTTIPSRRKAEEYLQEARSSYRLKDFEPEKLYLCVKYYRLYVAHIPEGVFQDTEDEKRYKEMLKELVNDVDQMLRKIFLLVKQRNWTEARNKMNYLLDDKIPRWARNGDPEVQAMVENRFIPAIEYIQQKCGIDESKN